MNRKDIKLKAKKLIVGNKWNIFKPYVLVWLVEIAVLFTLRMIISSFGVDSNEIIGAFSSCVTIFIYPASIGITYYLLSFVRGNKVDAVESLKKYYKYFGPIIMTFILVGIFTTLWTLLLIVPGIIAAISYSMVPYILADEVNEKTDVMYAIKKSKNMMIGYKWDYFVFLLSFIGWILLSVLTLGILYIWLLPYMQVANTLYYEELKNKQLKNIKN